MAFFLLRAIRRRNDRHSFAYTGSLYMTGGILARNILGSKAKVKGKRQKNSGFTSAPTYSFDFPKLVFLSGQVVVLPFKEEQRSIPGGGRMHDLAYIDRVVPTLTAMNHLALDGA